MEIYVDLSDYYNHSIFYNENWETSKNPDVNQIYCVAGVSLLDDIAALNNEIFYNCYFNCKINLRTNFDNMVCDGQEIRIENKKYSKICFLGFCDYGTVKDSIKVDCGNIQEQFDIVLKTFHTFDYQAINDNETNAQCKLVKKLRGSDGQKRNIYFWEIDVSKLEYNLKKITFPINPVLHILAVTLK